MTIEQLKQMAKDSSFLSAREFARQALQALRPKPIEQVQTINQPTNCKTKQEVEKILEDQGVFLL